MTKTALLSLLAALVACGGGGSDTSAVPAAPAAPPPPPAPAAPTDTSAAATTAPPAASAAPAPAAAPAGPAWAVSGTWAEACSCNIPCPCLADKMPTLGHCNETMIFHVDKGNYDKTTLDGLDVVVIGQSTHGKTFNQGLADKDFPIVNTYLPANVTDDVAAAADAVFTRLSFAMPTAGKKHAVKKLGITAKFATDTLDIEIPGVLTAHMKAQKNKDGTPKTFDALVPTGVFGKGVQGVSLSLDFHDDGAAWKIKNRHAAWTPFAWDSTKGPLPWEPGYKALTP
jgi:hypothetical protein